MFESKPLSDEAKRAQIEALYGRSKGHFPEVPDITAEELLEMREREPVVIVDVRQPAEQEVSMIAGAVTARQFEASGAEHRDATVVTYCTLGHRSGLYAQQLQNRGWKVRNLKGSILAWTHAGGELVDGDGATRRVHVYGPRWSLAAGDYEPVW